MLIGCTKCASSNLNAFVYSESCSETGPGACFSKLPVITGPIKAVLFSIKNRSFKSFENRTVKLSGKETKWTSLEVRTYPTFLETLISKYDLGPVKLLGLSRNVPWVGQGVENILYILPSTVKEQCLSLRILFDAFSFKKEGTFPTLPSWTN